MIKKAPSRELKIIMRRIPMVLKEESETSVALSFVTASLAKSVRLKKSNKKTTLSRGRCMVIILFIFFLRLTI